MNIEDVLSKKKVKKIKKIPAPFDTGGKDAAKERAEKWKEIEKQEKLQEIRNEKRLKLLKEKIEKQKKEDDKAKLQIAYQIWQKMNYLLFMCMKRDAYQRLDAYRISNPQLYKALVRCLIEPQVIRNIDAFVERVRKHGIPEKINMKTLLWYEDRLLGRKRESKIEVQHKGERRRTIS